MLDNNDSLLAEHPDWQLVLLAYAEIEAAAAAEAAELTRQKRKEAKAAAKLAEEQSADSTDENAAEDASTESPTVPGPILSDDDEDADEVAGIGWTERLREIEGVPFGRLAPIHGKLIAFGWLKYLLQGRSAGILYRVSTDGKRLLNQLDSDRVQLVARMQAAGFGCEPEERLTESIEHNTNSGETIAA